MSGRTLRRSTTTSIVCLSFFFSFGSVSASWIFATPSLAVPPPERTRNRTKPCACIASNSSACSPLRFATTGARIISLVSSGSASAASTICETLCASSGIS